MYCRELFIAVTKHVPFRIRWTRNYAAANSYLSYSRKMNIDYSPKMLTTRTVYEGSEQQYSKRRTERHFMLSAGILFSLFDFWKTDEEEPELIMTLKRAILLMQKGEHKKAEQMLHIALNQAQILQNDEGITYAYDLMANLAFDTKEYQKAKDLFVAVLQRLISRGTAQNDLKVIHISLKIAKIFEELGDIEKAEHGYSFCLEELRNCPIQDDNNETIALLGMTLDWFGHMLFSQSKYMDSLKYISEAYDICVKLSGEVSEQSIVLLSDLGTVYYMLGQYDTALEHLSKAAKIGSSLVDMIEFGSVHVNLGNVFLKKGMIEEAKAACEKGKYIARSREDAQTIAEANKCLDKIHKYLASVKQ